MEQIEFKNQHGITVHIEQDVDTFDPRQEFDHVGKMVCFHGRYNLGDQDHGFEGPEEVQEFIEKTEGLVVLPVYLYDHSGLTVNTTGFHCPWDSGQLGVIYCTQQQVDNEFCGDREAAEKCLRAEVSEYDQYLRGDIYCYLVKDENGETLDSCCGFYGYEHATNEARGAARGHVELIKEATEKAERADREAERMDWPTVLV